MALSRVLSCKGEKNDEAFEAVPRGRLFLCPEKGSGRIGDECTGLLFRRAFRAPRVRVPPAPLFSTERRGHAVTLLDLGRIASRYDTETAHAMLHAVAVARARGGARWFA